MKNKVRLFSCLIIMLIACNTTGKSASGEVNVEPVLRTAPFSKGVNFSLWFEFSSAQSINFTRYTEQDFADVKSLGVDVIRLPVRLHDMTDGAPNYTVDPLLFKFLDTALDWAEKYKIYIIIDNHSASTDSNIDRILVPVWEQIALRYKDRSNFIVYEILNEPYGIPDRRWGEIQEIVIKAIRRIDQKHAIVVSGTDYSSIAKLSSLPEYDDDNLIYTFHFYDPFLFTHQGAGVLPLMETLSGIPFPYERARMPNMPSAVRGTWIERAYNVDYRREAAFSALNGTLDKAVAFSRARNVPVYCGEYGVYMFNSGNDDRVRWYEFVTNALDRRNIARTSWDYYGVFGIFNDGDGDFNSDLNTGVVNALGFTPPVQTPRTIRTPNTGFVIYDDYPNRQYTFAGHWGEGSEFSLNDSNSAQGEFAIRWGNAPQHSGFWFNFEHNGNFSELVRQNYCLEFKARTFSSVIFDVRFINSDKTPSYPWRICYAIDNSILPPDGNWHTIRIPFSNMREQGAWVDSTQQWFDPRGDFSWEKVNNLEFASEHGNIKGLIWFDDIKITR
jgi:endoglucanase